MNLITLAMLSRYNRLDKNGLLLAMNIGLMDDENKSI
jgi:hypothetical protein